MTSLESVLDTNWDATNVAKPTIVTGPKYGRYLYSRILFIRRTLKTEDYMGIVSSTFYTPDTHDAYMITVGSETKADTEAITDELRRICAEFSPTSAENLLQLEGGEWDEPTAYWHMFTFVIMKRKSGRPLPNT